MKIILLLFSLCFVFTGCGNNKKEDISSRMLPPETVKMEIQPDKYDTIPSKVLLSISNNTQDTIQFGATYEIEKYTGSTWQSIGFSDQIAFIDILYILAPGETGTYELFLYPDITEYQPGRYRVRKTISAGNNTEAYYAGFDLAGN